MPMEQSSISRREFLRCASSAAVAAPFVLRNRYQLFAGSSEEYPERVVRLIREELVIDMLNQFLYRKDKEKLLNDWLTKPGAFTKSDFEFFMNSGVNAINFGDGAGSLDEAEKLFAKWNSFLLDYPQWLARINSADDFEKIKRQGRYGIIFGLQSSAQFENSGGGEYVLRLWPADFTGQLQLPLPGCGWRIRATRWRGKRVRTENHRTHEPGRDGG